MEDGSRIEILPHLNGPAGSGQGGYSKHRAGARLFSADGEVRAIAEAVLIELDELPGAARS